MDLTKLRYFKVVAQTEHISRAAEKLHISQPALSKTIALLEEELGVSLFDRIGRRIELNDYGIAFLRYVETALNSIDNGLQVIKSMENPYSSRLKLQTNITGDAYLLDMITSFRKEYPHVCFEIIKNYQKSKFLNNCDLYIHAVQIPLYKCVSIPIFAEEILLGVPGDHPLSTLSRISLQQVQNEPFITLSKETSWYEETNDFCIRSGFKPNIIYECDGTEMVAKLIGAGEGVGFLPAKSWGSFSDNVSLLRINNISCRRDYNLSWQLEQPYNPLIEKFKDHMKKYFELLNNDIDY